MVRIFLTLAALVVATGCLVRDNPCAEDSRAPAWLASQCQLAESEGETDTQASSDTDTDTGATVGGTGSAGVSCKTRADCCPEPDGCDQKCVFIGDGRRLCYGSGFGAFHAACDNFEDELRDSCDTLHMCVTFRDDDADADDDEGYCKPLCDDLGGCPNLPLGYACEINGLCRSYCDPLLLDGCEEGEACRWIFDDGASRFDCQPVDLDDSCVPQLKPDQPGDCEPGSMCIEEIDGGIATWRCASFCSVGASNCQSGQSCEPFAGKIPATQRPDPPHVSDLGLCSG